MRRIPVLAALLIAVALPGLALPGAAVAGSRPAVLAGSPFAAASTRHAQLVAFHFGRSRGFGGRGFFGGRGRRSHHFLRHIVHALAFAYVLHLLFSHGGISILFWLIVIAVVVHLFRRRRRARPSY